MTVEATRRSNAESKELMQKVKEMILAGMPSIRIAEKLGKSKHAIYYCRDRLLESGEITSVPKGPRKLKASSLELRAKVLQLYKQGLTSGEMAKILGIARQNVAVHVRALSEDQALE